MAGCALTRRRNDSPEMGAERAIVCHEPVNGVWREGGQAPARPSRKLAPWRTSLGMCACWPAATTTKLKTSVDDFRWNLGKLT